MWEARLFRDITEQWDGQKDKENIRYYLEKSLSRLLEANALIASINFDKGMMQDDLMAVIKKMQQLPFFMTGRSNGAYGKFGGIYYSLTRLETQLYSAAATLGLPRHDAKPLSSSSPVDEQKRARLERGLAAIQRFLRASVGLSVRIQKYLASRGRIFESQLLSIDVREIEEKDETFRKVEDRLTFEFEQARWQPVEKKLRKIAAAKQRELKGMIVDVRKHRADLQDQLSARRRLLLKIFLGEDVKQRTGLLHRMAEQALADVKRLPMNLLEEPLTGMRDYQAREMPVAGIARGGPFDMDPSL